jgi:hypothetical protein
MTQKADPAVLDQLVIDINPAPKSPYGTTRYDVVETVVRTANDSGDPIESSRDYIVVSKPYNGGDKKEVGHLYFSEDGALSSFVVSRDVPFHAVPKFLRAIA